MCSSQEGEPIQWKQHWYMAVLKKCLYQKQTESEYKLLLIYFRWVVWFQNIHAIWCMWSGQGLSRYVHKVDSEEWSFLISRLMSGSRALSLNGCINELNQLMGEKWILLNLWNEKTSSEENWRSVQCDSCMEICDM